jgi:uncharacterized membrane protein
MELLVLRIVHVLGAIFWVGSGIFSTFFLQPAMVEAGPAAGQVAAGLQRRRLFTVLPIVALLTILSGARLMWITSGGFSPAYFTSPMGRMFLLGAAAGIVAFLFGITFVRPAGERMGATAAALATATDAEQRAQLAASLAALGKKLRVSGLFVTALIILAAVAMAIARYVG